MKCIFLLTAFAISFSLPLSAAPRLGITVKSFQFDTNNNFFLTFETTKIQPHGGDLVVQKSHVTHAEIRLTVGSSSIEDNLSTSALTRWKGHFEVSNALFANFIETTPIDVFINEQLFGKLYRSPSNNRPKFTPSRFKESMNVDEVSETPSSVLNGLNVQVVGMTVNQVNITLKVRTLEEQGHNGTLKLLERRIISEQPTLEFIVGEDMGDSSGAPTMHMPVMTKWTGEIVIDLGDLNPFGKKTKIKINGRKVGTIIGGENPSAIFFFSVDGTRYCSDSFKSNAVSSNTIPDQDLK